jgi:hypothetical protein
LVFSVGAIVLLPAGRENFKDSKVNLVVMMTALVSLSCPVECSAEQGV